jgi:ribosomal protein S18 acetylase RimI-like enzyme
MCYLFGDVFLSDDRKGCALILLPEKKKTSLKSILLDLKLIFTSTGLSNVNKAMDRESKIKKLHPPDPMYYLWFIGVNPTVQNRGTGTTLLKDVIKQAEIKNRSVYLETSTLKNIPCYEKFRFKVYNELDLGYRLYFLKN